MVRMIEGEVMEDKKATSQKRLKKLVRAATMIVAAVVPLALIFVGYVYANSPEVIRNPKLEHYHFRMQILDISSIART